MSPKLSVPASLWLLSCAMMKGLDSLYMLPVKNQLSDTKAGADKSSRPQCYPFSPLDEIWWISYDRGDAPSQADQVRPARFDIEIPNCAITEKGLGTQVLEFIKCYPFAAEVFVVCGCPRGNMASRDSICVAWIRDFITIISTYWLIVRHSRCFMFLSRSLRASSHVQKFSEIESCSHWNRDHVYVSMSASAR